MSARPRRSGARWAIAIVIVAAVMAVLAVGAELIARQVVPDLMRAAVVERLALPADHPVDVEIAGILIPQLLGGVLHDVEITSQDVTVGAFSGDVVARGEDIPIRADAPATGGTAEVRMTTEQLRALLATIEGFPADSVELEAPNVTAASDVELLGAAIPVGITLEPSAADGQIVLTPVEGTIAGATVTADGLRDQLGSLADPILQDRRLCIADSIPAAMTLRSVEVVDDALLAGFDIDGGIIDDPALQANGTC